MEAGLHPHFTPIAETKVMGWIALRNLYSQIDTVPYYCAEGCKVLSHTAGRKKRRAIISFIIINDLLLHTKRHD